MMSMMRLGLRQNIVNIKRKLATSKLIRVGRGFFVKHTLSVGILLFSMILAISGIVFVWNFYDTENPPTDIELYEYSNDCIRISEGSVIIDYRDQTNDEKQTLRLILHVTCEGSSLQGKTIQFYVSPNLRLADRFNDSSNLQQFQQHYSYTFPYSGSVDSFDVYFEGNIFGSDATQLNMDFNINSSYVPQPIPIKLIIVSLSNLDITDVVPQPDNRYPFAIEYNNLIISDDFLGINLKISGIDRPRMNQNQLMLLFVGLGLGLVFSMITTILYEFVLFIDDARVKEKALKARAKRVSEQ